MSHVLRSHSGLVVAVVVVILVGLAGVGCSTSPSSFKGVGSPPEASAPAPAQPPSLANQDQASTERMIIRNVALSLVVADVDVVLAAIGQLASDMEGFVVSAESSESDGNRGGRVTLRVPSDRLDEAVGRIKGLAQRVPRETAANKDVTEEYVDQDARLRNLRATEAQYLDVLKQAKTVEEIINVRKALSEVREQIERTEARLQFLLRSVEMASISVDLTTSAAAQPLQWGDWNLFATLREAVQGLIGVVLFLVTLGIWIVALSPVWLPAYLLFRWWRRRRPRKPALPPSS